MLGSPALKASRSLARRSHRLLLHLLLRLQPAKSDRHPRSPAQSAVPPKRARSRYVESLDDKEEEEERRDKGRSGKQRRKSVKDADKAEYRPSAHSAATTPKRATRSANVALSFNMEEQGRRTPYKPISTRTGQSLFRSPSGSSEALKSAFERPVLPETSIISPDDFMNPRRASLRPSTLARHESSAPLRIAVGESTEHKEEKAASSSRQASSNPNANSKKPVSGCPMKPMMISASALNREETKRRSSKPAFAIETVKSVKSMMSLREESADGGASDSSSAHKLYSGAVPEVKMKEMSAKVAFEEQKHEQERRRRSSTLSAPDSQEESRISTSHTESCSSNIIQLGPDGAQANSAEVTQAEKALQLERKAVAELLFPTNEVPIKCAGKDELPALSAKTARLISPPQTEAAALDVSLQLEGMTNQYADDWLKVHPQEASDLSSPDSPPSAHHSSTAQSQVEQAEAAEGDVPNAPAVEHDDKTPLESQAREAVLEPSPSLPRCIEEDMCEQQVEVSPEKLTPPLMRLNDTVRSRSIIPEISKGDATVADTKPDSAAGREQEVLSSCLGAEEHPASGNSAILPETEVEKFLPGSEAATAGEQPTEKDFVAVEATITTESSCDPLAVSARRTSPPASRPAIDKEAFGVSEIIPAAAEIDLPGTRNDDLPPTSTSQKLSVEGLPADVPGTSATDGERHVELNGLGENEALPGRIEAVDVHERGIAADTMQESFVGPSAAAEAFVPLQSAKQPIQLSVTGLSEVSLDQPSRRLSSGAARGSRSKHRVSSKPYSSRRHIDDDNHMKEYTRAVHQQKQHALGSEYDASASLVVGDLQAGEVTLQKLVSECAAEQRDSSASPSRSPLLASALPRDELSFQQRKHKAERWQVTQTAIKAEDYVDPNGAIQSRQPTSEPSESLRDSKSEKSLYPATEVSEPDQMYHERMDTLLEGAAWQQQREQIDAWQIAISSDRPETIDPPMNKYPGAVVEEDDLLPTACVPKQAEDSASVAGETSAGIHDATPAVTECQAASPITADPVIDSAASLSLRAPVVTMQPVILVSQPSLDLQATAAPVFSESLRFPTLKAMSTSHWAPGTSLASAQYDCLSVAPTDVSVEDVWELVCPDCRTKVPDWSKEKRGRDAGSTCELMAWTRSAVFEVSDSSGIHVNQEGTPASEQPDSITSAGWLHMASDLKKQAWAQSSTMAVAEQAAIIADAQQDSLSPSPANVPRPVRNFLSPKKPSTQSSRKKETLEQLARGRKTHLTAKRRRRIEQCPSSQESLTRTNSELTEPHSPRARNRKAASPMRRPVSGDAPSTLDLPPQSGYVPQISSIFKVSAQRSPHDTHTDVH